MEPHYNWDDMDREARKARKKMQNRKKRGRRHEDRQNLRSWVDDINSGRKGRHDDYGDEE